LSSVLSNNPLNNENINTVSYTKKVSSEKPVFSPDNFGLTVEGGIMFFNYLKNFKLIQDPDILIIYPDHFFYFDKNDFKAIKTLLILKKLNLIKDVESFLESLHNILPLDVIFIGCFSDYRTIKANGLVSRLTKNVINLLDSKTDSEMDKKYVSALLLKNGFKIVDMTEMNELVYFCSRHVLNPTESPS
jgi:hypothetical protein